MQNCCLLCWLWLFVPPVRRGWVVGLVFFLYVGQLGYAVYEGFVRSYYLLEPVFYNDFFLFADGMRYVFRQFVSFAPSLCRRGVWLLALLVGLLFGLHRLLFSAGLPGKLSRVTRLALVGLGMTVLVQLVMVKGEVGGVETAVTSFAAKINQNIQLSRLAQAEAARFDSQDLTPFYQFTDAKLQQKPNIYVIFVESYGSILYKRFYYRTPHKITAQFPDLTIGTK